MGAGARSGSGMAFSRITARCRALEALAAQYGVSRERVRQIEVRAFEKLQKAMRAAAIEQNMVAA